MNILSIDTSTRHGSVAVVRDDRLLCERSYTADSSHAELLLGEIDKCLKKARLSLSEIDCFAVDIGPGSFTGLRIGLATAKGLALAEEKPIVGISSLAALVYPLNRMSFPRRRESREIPAFAGMTDIWIPCLDAYRNEVYASVGGAEMSVTPEELCKIVVARFIGPNEPDKSGNYRLLFVGDGAVRYKDIFKERLGDRFEFAGKKHLYPKAESVARLALQRFKEGRADDLVSLVPNYIRRSDAEIKLKDRGGSHG